MTEQPREGWAAGTTDGGEWLTILGSHWAPPMLYAFEADAWAAIPANLPEETASRMVVAYVREVWHADVTGDGRAYRIARRATDYAANEPKEG